MMNDSTNSKFLNDFIHIITMGVKSNTYKFALAKSILEFVKDNEPMIRQNIKNKKNTPIEYSVFANDFFRYFWRMRKSRIPQNHNTESIPRAVRIVNKIYEEKDQPEKFEQVDEKIKKDSVSRILKGVFGKYSNKTSQVVPRFQNIRVGSKVITNEIFYKNDESNKRILIFPEAMEFFITNNVLLQKLVILEWAKFLENIATAPGIIGKIENPNHDRKSLKSMEKILRPFMKNCFYCNQSFSESDTGEIHVDHFIPRAYVDEDELWNLVLACSRCNCNKRSSLAVDFVDKLKIANDTNRKKIKKLDDSIKKLEYTMEWDTETKSSEKWKKKFDSIYRNCKEYSFSEISKEKILERKDESKQSNS